MHRFVECDPKRVEGLIRVNSVHRFQAMNRVYWCVAASIDFASKAMALTPEGEPYFRMSQGMLNDQGFGLIRCTNPSVLMW